jgi:hypothetical protein
MFDSYASGGNARASANNYLKINAISGTLIKNHPKSIFVRAKKDDTIFDPTNPRCVFPNAETYMATHSYDTGKYISGYGWEKGYYQKEAKRDKEVPCVVLQAMIIGEDSFLCEIVTLDDFYGDTDVVENKVEE